MAVPTAGAELKSGERSALAKVLSIGGILAALGASSCCVIPFALFSLGVSGAWIADITALEPYQPLFVVVALACLGGGFLHLRRRSRVAWAEGSYCARPASDRVVRIGLWTAAALVVVAVAFPRIASLFLTG
jgi:mercuric ion transport protein